MAHRAGSTVPQYPTAPCLTSSQPDQQEALVRRIQKGDAAAYNELYRLDYHWSYLAAARLVGNPDDAEDLAARAWAIIWLKARDLNEPAAFRGWVKQVLTRLAQEDYRARARQGALGDPLPLPEEGDERPPDPDQLDPVGDEALFRVTDLAAAYARLEAELQAVQQELSPAAAAFYEAILTHIARYRWAEPRTLRSALAAEFRLTRNAASMRMLEIFKKAARRGLPLETILADAELTGAARPVFQQAARQRQQPGDAVGSVGYLQQR